EEIQLADEGGPRGVAGAQGGRHELDGDLLAARLVLGAVDGAHGAAAKLLVDDVGAEFFADEHCVRPKPAGASSSLRGTPQARRLACRLVQTVLLQPTRRIER